MLLPLTFAKKPAQKVMTCRPNFSITIIAVDAQLRSRCAGEFAWKAVSADRDTDTTEHRKRVIDRAHRWNEPEFARKAFAANGCSLHVAVFSKRTRYACRLRNT